MSLIALSLIKYDFDIKNFPVEPLVNPRNHPITGIFKERIE